MFSKTCEYAIRATIYIAEQSQQGNRVGQKSVADAIDSPEAFTAKILQQLAKNKLINSDKGPNGGFSMDKTLLEKITLSHIVSTFDGDNIYKGCGLGLKTCNEAKPCPVHNQFKAIRNALSVMLENTTISDLTTGLKVGFTFLKS